jgi:LAO/AO transport system kinase
VPAADDVAALVARGRDADPRATARLLSLVENGGEHLRAVVRALGDRPARARTVGVTGSPGVGKSTLVAALVTAYRRAGARVGVLAVDPTSPFTGGALLGDRVRMQHLATDPGVFIRSLATRGHLGGLSWATPQAVRVLDAVGCDVVVVETVGVGQSEVEVAGIADTTLVVLAPGLGDGIQAAKAGILEVGDVFVVNKADREGADLVVRDLLGMLRMAAGASPDAATAVWVPPVVRTVAVREEGIAELLAAVDDHQTWLETSGTLEAVRLRRARHEVEALAQAEFHRSVGRALGEPGLADLAAAVAAGRLDPYTAADTLVAAVARLEG